MKRERPEDEEVSLDQIRGAILSREIAPVNDGWQVIEELPERMPLGPNVREKSDAFIRILAFNILSQGQIQECTGDTKDGVARVWAGHHRFWAVELVNALIDEINRENSQKKTIAKFKLRVRVKGREFTEEEKLQVQIAENLHRSIRPEEEAAAIFGIFSFYQRAMVSKRTSIADFSRRIGFGEAKVGNAVRFIQLDSRVRMLVENGALLYSVATRLSRIANEKQLVVAIKIVTHRLNDKQIDSLIKQTIGEVEMFSIFSPQEEQKLEAENNRLRFRKEINSSAREASGYFRRVLSVIELVADKKIELTEPVRDILAGFICESEDFRAALDIANPELSRKLSEALKSEFQE